MATPQLRLDQISLMASVGTHALLQDISFEVMQGDRVAIVGPSGAGKTSLLRLLNRLNDPTQGTIWFEDQALREIPVIQLRQQIVLVSQESKLLGMTVRQALEYPLVLRKMSQQMIQQRLLTWTEKMHLPQEWMDRTEVQLSVGQRQWVSITRALMLQPKVLLLDEPTSALDAGRSRHLIHTLVELAQNQQMTILMANHQLDLAEQFGVKVLYLQQGRLIQDSPVLQVDWSKLKQSLVDAEAQIAEDWE